MRHYYIYSNGIVCFTQLRKGRKIQAADVYLFTTAAPVAGAFSLVQGTDEVTFSDSQVFGDMKSFVAKDIGLPMSNWQIKINDVKVKIETLWLVARYILT